MELNKYEMSHSQKRIWLYDQLEYLKQSDGKYIYNLLLAIRIGGNLNIERFKKAFQLLVDKHAVFRTTYEEFNNVPFQVIHDALDVEVDQIELKDTLSEDELEEYIRNNFVQEWDLKKLPLFKTALIRLGDEKHIFVLTIHHILFDGWSSDILFNELMRFYKQLGDGKLSYTHLPLQYYDYAQWHNGYVKSEKVLRAETCLAERFKEGNIEIPFPYKNKREKIQNFSGSSVNIDICDEIFERVCKFCVRYHISHHNFFLTCFLAALYKFSYAKELVIGIPLSGRTHPDIKDIIGCFINTLPMKTVFEDNITFEELSQQCKREVGFLMDYQDYPLDFLVKSLKIDRSMNRNPIYSIIFQYHTCKIENDYMVNGSEEELSFDFLNVKPKTSIFDFSMELIEQNNKVSGYIQFATALLKKSTIEDLKEAYLKLINTMLSDYQAVIDNIGVLHKDKRQRILDEFNKTDSNYKQNKTAIQIFKETVQRMGERTALLYKEENISYRQLDERSNKIARLIREKGCRRNEYVAVLMEKSADFGVSILSILKCGAAYLPIDSDLPIERVKYILEDSQANIVISKSNFKDKIKNMNIGNNIIFIDGEPKEKEKNISDITDIERMSPIPLDYDNFNNNMKAYMIYTSGTTGYPKGVEIPGRAMLNHLCNEIDKVKLKECDVVLQTASFSFDTSVWQFFAPLIIGAKVVIIEKEKLVDPQLLVDFIETNKITIIDFVPNVLNILVNYLDNHRNRTLKISKSVRCILSAGAVLPKSTVEKWFDLFDGIRVINSYGPTETADRMTHFPMDSKEDFMNYEHLPIGNVLNNSKVYILDSKLNMVPFGVKGEICVSGICLSTGYWNNKELTAEKFKKNPYFKGDNNKYEYIYRTGDVGFWDEEGILNISGRTDNQVKIRGFRIELEEVDSVILKCFREITNSVSILKQNGEDDSYLVSFYVTNVKISEDCLKKILADKLPSYMVPRIFVELKEMPLLETGKINRKVLETFPIYKDEYDGVAEDESLSETEKAIKKIWEQELENTNDIGRETNFFLIGGHSLLAIKIINKVRDIYRIEIPLQSLFNSPILKDFAKIVEESKINVMSGQVFKKINIKSYDRKVKYELAPVQLPEWYLHELEPTSSFYNINFSLVLKGNLDKENFLKSVSYLLHRHEIFKVVFNVVDGMPCQFLTESLQNIIEYRDKSYMEDNSSSKDMKQEIERESKRIFDLYNGPLYKICLIKYAENIHLFIMTTHHIVWDETSTVIFMKELSSVYNYFNNGESPNLPNLTLNYFDYSQWMADSLKNGEFDVFHDFWLNKFDTIPEILQLPTDWPKKEVQTYNGATIYYIIDKALQMKIEIYCKENGVTLYIFMLSVLDLWIYRLTGNKDFVIGSPVQNRDYLEFEKIIGLFAGALLLRNRVDSDKDFKNLLEYVKKEVVDSVDNHLYPSNYLINELKSGNSLNGEFFNIMFGVQGEKSDLLKNITFNNLEVEVQYLDIEYDTSRFDITLAIEQMEDLIIDFNYCTDLFKEETARRLVAQFVMLIQDVLKNDSKNLDAYSLLLVADKEIIQSVNDTEQVSNEMESSICDSISAAALCYPNVTAVQFGLEKLTYQELEEKTDALAGHLSSSFTLDREDKVGVIFKPGIDCIIAIVSILKIGCAYVPIGYDYPEERIIGIARQAKMKLLITEQDSFLEIEGCPVIEYGYKTEHIEKREFLAEKIAKDNLAYVIFTSGSTGQPKGIEIEHGSMINLFSWTKKEYGINEKDVFLFITSYTFDVSILEILFPLTIGSKIVIASEEDRKNPSAIGALTSENKVSVLQFVPEMLNSFITSYELGGFPSPEHLKYVVSAGNILQKSLAERFNKNFKCRLSNHYGPAEATVDSIFYHCEDIYEGDSVPIGKPIDNCQIFLLNDQMIPVPIGVSGEIYIASHGLARGYINNEKLTKERFIYYNIPGYGERRLYKTGDIAKYLPNGDIVFLGRKDNQKKIRGNRIELEEIDISLNKISGISGAISIVKDHNLHAFIELKNNYIYDREGKLYYLYTLSQMPYRMEEVNQINEEVWPAYFKYNEATVKYWPEIFKRYNEYQIILVSENDEIVAIGHTLPIFYRAEEQELPRGWDGAIKNVICKENNTRDNTLLVLAGIVNPAFRGRGLSEVLITAFKKLASAKEFHKILIPVRPVGKSKYPKLSIQEYAAMRREDGQLLDYWLRVHEKVGGRMLDVEESSQLVEAPLNFWESYRTCTDNKGYFFEKDCLSCVNINYERNLGIYHDPCVWMLHELKPEKNDRYFNINYDSINNELTQCLLGYMIPQSYSFLKKLPTTSSGKYDRKYLAEQFETNHYSNECIVRPSNQIEKSIQEIWGEILNLHDISVDDDFYEIGGNSISAAMMIHKVNLGLGINYQLRDFLQNTTIKKMSIRILSSETYNRSSLFIKLKILPYHNQNNDCYEDQLITILNWFGEKDYLYMYADLWNFSYEPMVDTKLLGNKLNAGSDIGHIIERVENIYGMRVEEQSFDNHLDALAFIEEQIELGNPISIISHSFYCPWDPAYQKYVDKNCSIVIGIDKEHEQIICTDCFNSMYGVSYDFKDFELAFTGKCYSFVRAFGKREVENSELLKIVITNIEKVSQKIFEDIKLFANDFLEVDLKGELNATIVQYSELYRKIYSIRRRRLQVMSLLQKKLKVNFENKVLLLFGEVCEKWNRIYLLLAKAYLKPESKKIIGNLSNMMSEVAEIERAAYLEIKRVKELLDKS